MTDSIKTVVVTGISGYVGKWVALKLLEKGYAVRGTLRDPGKQAQVRETLAQHLGADAVARLSFATADLLNAADWPAALEGADAVMHVATQVVGQEPRDAGPVVHAALDGTRNVLTAAYEAGVRRVIATSSIATVGYGQGHRTGRRVYTEANFTNLDGMRWKWAYCIGKTRAEQFAWAYAKEQGLSLTTIHPGMILGPPLDTDSGVSVGLISGLMTGNPSAYPDLGFSLSDVRDVADMHVAALENGEASGQRYLCTASYMHFGEIAAILRKAFPEAPVPERAIPEWLLHLLAYVVRDLRQVINDVGNEKVFDGAKGRALLGRAHRPEAETIIDCARSLIDLGIVAPKPNT